MFFLSIALALAVALLALGTWFWRRTTRPSSGRNDRYAPERILTTEQVHMLDYLQDTFPGQIVLPHVLLKDMLSIRRADDHQRAAQRLGQQRLDFVVCGEDGRPSFAFDIEQHHLSDAKAKAYQVKMKNRILKTAGVRFVLLKNGLHRMPAPAEFRKQLNLAALPQPRSSAAARESAMQQLESQFSEFDQHYTSTSHRDAEVMGLSSLMDLEPSARRRGHTDRRPEQPGISRYDGSAMDVRGG